ncbi:hypothetical protein [Paenibacillus sp. y28]|uniref:hypothetical protein n=1 Tax=Paenibacillus sp. y28 TaxID=3129110 RepID=UPI003019426F
MKRYLMLIVAALMIFSMVACSSSEGPKSTPQAETTASPTPTSTATPAPSESPTPTPDATTSPAPTESPAATAAPTATVTPDAASPAPTAAPTAAPQKSEPAKQPASKPEAPAEKAEISPQGKKLLLVGRERSNGELTVEDKKVADRMKALGFNVTQMVDKSFTPSSANGYDLLYISQTLNSKYIKDGVMKNTAVPTVYVKNHGMFYLDLSSIEEGANINYATSIDIVDPNHKVAAGLSGNVVVLKESVKVGVGYGLPGKEAKVIATGAGDKGKATIYYYDKGAKGDGGYTTKARISYFFMNNGMDENMTDAGWKLLDNLVVWTLQNG